MASEARVSRKRQKLTKTCETCGKVFPVKPSHYQRRKTCSRSCDGKRKEVIYLGEANPNFGNKGESNPLFKGGRRLNPYGYVLVYRPEHPNSRPDGYIFEHRLVMSEHLGRPLSDEEHVHHIDGNKQNNDISNLELTTLSEHTSHHNKENIIIRDEFGRFKHVIKVMNLGEIG